MNKYKKQIEQILFKNNNYITYDELAAIMGISTNTLQNNIKKHISKLDITDYSIEKNPKDLRKNIIKINL